MSELSKEMALAILADGNVKGKELSEKQVAFFKAVADGTREPKEKKEKKVNFEKLDFL